MSFSFPPSDLSVLDHPGVTPWLSALATVSQELADAQDEAALAATLSRAVRPPLGDLGILYVFDADGILRPVVAADLAPSTPLGRLHAHEAQSAETTVALARVARGGIMRMADDDASWLALLSQDGEHLAPLQAIGLRAVALAPLTLRGTVTGLLLLGSTDPERRYGSAVALLISLLASVVASSLGARAAEQREAALVGRLDALVQAARELAHLVNNDLTLPVGALEILLDRPEHPPELREMLAAAATDLSAAEEHIRGFHQLARGETPAGLNKRPLAGPGHP